MSNTTISPNMNLIVPTVGVDPGPDWANNLNADLSILDSHNHSPGFGVQIQPNGLNINSDLTFNANNAISLKTVRFSPQVSPIPNSGSNVGCLYVSGNEIYYNDVSGGHQVQLTTNGSVNSGSGSITGLPSGTASASFSAGTFVWQSATSTAANMDFGSAILRNSSANSKGLTLQPPAAMAADITETLPAIPGSTSFMQIDSSGNMSASIAVSGGITASNIASGTITSTQLGAASVGTTQLANTSVTKAKLAALGQQVSSGCGSFNAPTSFGNVTNLSVAIATIGRPVWIGFISDGTNNARLTTTSGSLFVRLLRDGTPFAQYQMTANNGAFVSCPGSTIFAIDTGANASTHTYTAQAQYTTVSSGNAAVESVVLFAYEL